MDRLSEIKSVTDYVKELLISKPDNRDDDRKLVANVWSKQSGGLRKLQEMNAYDFLLFYCRHDKLSSYDSITRARRKLQEQFPELRGASYAKRQEQEASVRKEINA